ncbi:hypothetical protein ACM3E3_004592 [Escherichia coli]|nr:hypothetical protein [Escherichia coli]MED8075061.1 hypothetical protein [Escherichia coli]MED8079894.1 hypothetical protein [Escherichia coli]MED8118526.1 hypothetical protein [Escherichia coli]MED8123382.1 hypothetical protein [Escherichia coli]MED8128201.1 hypothetical protein [Escherichia coli]
MVITSVLHDLENEMKRSRDVSAEILSRRQTTEVMPQTAILMT